MAWTRLQYERIREPGDTGAHFWAVMYSVIFGGLLGGKLGYFLVYWHESAAAPLRTLLDTRGGWVFWFAIGGSMAGGWVYQQWFNKGRPRKRRYLPIADYILGAVPLGHFFGRLACFANGCCYGRPTGLPWGVRFSHPASSVGDAVLGVPLHPVQLYESFGMLALFLFFLLHVLPGTRSGRYRHGTAFFGYLIVYSAMRFFLEFLRADDRGVLVSDLLTPSQWFSAAAFLIGGVMLWRRGIREPDPENRSVYY